MPRLRPSEPRDENLDVMYGVKYRHWGLNLNMEAAGFSETSVYIYESTRHIPEKCNVIIYLNFKGRELVERRPDIYLTAYWYGKFAGSIPDSVIGIFH